jgi:Glycosyl hydrolases family 2, sugar binding domain
MQRIFSLDGTWDFQLADHPPRSIQVPSAWEASDTDRITEGPARYRRVFSLSDLADEPAYFEADAIAFYCEVRVNGHVVGTHRGMWTAFAFDITHVVHPGDNTIEIEVWKPGGRFPLRECLAGFVADIANTFGGIWQSCRIVIGDRPGLPEQVPPTARLQIDGTTLRLDGRPAHLRGVLDWGWNPARIAPGYTAGQLRQQFAQARALGFNMVKLCLYVPEPQHFEIADEMDMLLWLELPLWLPVLTPASRQLILDEYDAILRRVRQHRSIVLLSLGCELDSAVDSDLLAEMRAIARRWMPNVPLCDNSGSAEAYGGVASQADFYDYHFYCDPHQFEPLVRHFDRSHRPARPWIFGEYADADTLRDFEAIDPATWWLNGPFTFKRDELDWTCDWRNRLAPGEAAQLSVAARTQATWTRKTIFELTRKHFASGGYVLTGWRDTPISTSGVVDDAGMLKFDPAEWRMFNADRVLLIDRAPRRIWRNGGDRPVYASPQIWQTGEAVELQVLLANGAHAVTGVLRGPLGGQRVEAPAAATTHIADVRMTASAVSPTQQWLELELQIDGGEVVRNRWPVLFLPAPETLQPELPHTVDAALLTRVRAGEHLTVWLQTADPGFCTHAPFVREAIHVFDPEWRPLGDIDIRPYMHSVATDIVVHPDRLSGVLGGPVQVLWGRVDARAMWHGAYVVRCELGAGSLTLSTLRHAGGAGAQPEGLVNNLLGAWLLRHGM